MTKSRNLELSNLALNAFASPRGISPEIALAIYQYAKHDLVVVERIWLAPTAHEQYVINEIAFGLAGPYVASLSWGDEKAYRGAGPADPKTPLGVPAEAPWLDSHRTAERLAAEAEIAKRSGDETAARTLYAEAAEAEEDAFSYLNPPQIRTMGILAVSAASCWLKAGDAPKARQFAAHVLSIRAIPTNAAVIDEMRDFL